MMDSDESRLKNLKNCFENVFGFVPEFGVRAPGRVNIIGEHTDYNEGFVLPAAIDRDVTILVKPRDDFVVRIYSETYREEISFDLRSIVHDREHSWSNYERGVADVLQKEGFILNGADMVLSGNIPLGSGLSSSAAVEVATAAAFRIIGNLVLSDRRIALLSQKAENEFVGMKCGIMDQFASCLSRENHALFLDCRSLEFEYVLVNMENLAIVLCNTNVPRRLVESEYNQRRQECEEGVKLISQHEPLVKALRDVTPAMLETHKSIFPSVVLDRCRHVVEENERVMRCVDEIKNENMDEVGRLLNQSHESLRDLYEVSCKELDVMAEIAWNVPGVYGARMMGGGFGGCTINLVHESAIEELHEAVEKQYLSETGYTPQIHICRTTDGVSKLDVL